MLVTTVTAMATDYVADCVVSCNNQESTMSGATMSVVDNGDGTYNITLKALKSTALGMDFGDLTLSNLSGTTEGGVTTISVAEVNAKFTSGDYMEAPESPIKSFVCKFNAEKLYANYGSGSMLRLNNWQRTAFTASFGTDEGFESTGGGSTGGEDKPAIVTVKENFQSTEGSSWGENVTIDWNTQKLVASINLASTGSDKGFLGVTKKGQTAGWNNYGIIFYNTNGSTVQGYAPGQPNNANTDQVTKGEDPVRFEISKDGGVKCQGNVVISASNIAHLTNQSEIVVGAADKPAGALYNYIKVVPLDWTEKTEPEVKEEKTFNEALYMVQGTTSTKVADAKVVVKEMSDETINMSLQFNENEYTSTELVKGTDEKNRTTYTGKISNGTQTFDVAGVVYEKETADRLYMTMTATGVTFVVGENPDAVTPEAVVYKNELTIVRGADHKVYNDAEVSVLAKGEGKYEVTLPEFADMDLTNSGTVGKIVFTANGEEVDGVLKLTAENAAGVISTGEGWTKYAADVTMSGEVANNQLAAKFTVVLGGMSDYTYTLGYGKEIFIPTTETVTDWANIKFGDSDPVNIENAKLDITMVSMSTAMVTFKDVMINGNNIGDFAISDVKASLNPEDNTTSVLTTEATKGTWVRATENNALGVIVGAESDIRNFEGTQDEDADKTVVKFGVFFGSAYGWADIVFGEKVETPEPPVEDYAVNFDKDANSTHNSRALNSFSLQQTGKDKQTKSVKTSKAAYEDHTADEPFTVEAGSELTASFDYTGEWMHSFVYIDFDNDGDFSYKEGQWDQTGTDLVAFSFYSLDSNPKNDASGYNSVGDELTGDARNTYVAPSFKAPAKAGEYRIRFKIDWNCILPGGSSSILSDGGGVWDATLKVVEPVVDGISTINAEVANGEAQLFTVDGVQIAKLQKGLNIVRTADGKVKKVLVK